MTLTPPLVASARELLRGAETALLDERRLLVEAELAALAALPDDQVPTLAAFGSPGAT